MNGKKAKLLRRIARLNKDEAGTTMVMVKKPLYKDIETESGEKKKMLKRAAKFQIRRADAGGRGYHALKEMYTRGVIDLKKV